MNQAFLLNSDLAFDEQRNLWMMTGFYQSQGITVYIQESHLSKNVLITSDILLDLEADIEDWLEINEPDEHNEIWL